MIAEPLTMKYFRTSYTIMMQVWLCKRMCIVKVKLMLLNSPVENNKMTAIGDVLGGKLLHSNTPLTSTKDCTCWQPWTYASSELGMILTKIIGDWVKIQLPLLVVVKSLHIYAQKKKMLSGCVVSYV